MRYLLFLPLFFLLSCRVEVWMAQLKKCNNGECEVVTKAKLWITRGKLEGYTRTIYEVRLMCNEDLLNETLRAERSKFDSWYESERKDLDEHSPGYFKGIVYRPTQEI